MKTQTRYLSVRKKWIVVFALLVLNSGSFQDVSESIFWYELKAKVCTLISNTRVYYSGEQKSIDPYTDLKPGDIIFTHRTGYLSNLFIPGYYTHAALFLGNAAEMEGNFPGCTAFTSPTDTSKDWVIEALNTGVTIQPVNQVVNACAVLVLRPKISDPARAKVIARALAMLDKPYDFNFDFNSADKISCSELIWRSYSEEWPFEIHRFMGKSFTTPDEMVQDHMHKYSLGNTNFEILLII